MLKNIKYIIPMSLMFMSLGFVNSQAQFTPQNEKSLLYSSFSYSEAQQPVNQLSNRKEKSAIIATLMAFSSTAGVLTLTYYLASATDLPTLTVGAIGFTGLVVAPSSGSLYARDYNQFFKGATARAGITGISLLFGNAAGGFSASGSREGGELFYLMGGAFILGHSLIDIFWGSWDSVQKYNAALGSSASVSVSPWVSKAQNSAGLSLRVDF